MVSFYVAFLRRYLHILSVEMAGLLRGSAFMEIILGRSGEKFLIQ
jgi:hypothetical protein